MLLGIVISTLENFTYHREFVNGRHMVLEFRAVLYAPEDKERATPMNVQGVDLITLDDDGNCSQFTVMIRPHNTLGVLKKIVAARMAEMMAEAGIKPPPKGRGTRAKL